MVPASNIGNSGLIFYKMNAVCENLSLAPAGWWVTGLCETLPFPWEKGWICLRHWVLFSFGTGVRGGDEVGVEARTPSLCSRLVPRCRWAPAQMQLEDKAAARESRAPCCSLCARASPVHVCVCARVCVRARVRLRQTWTETERRREDENMNEKSFLRRVQGALENVPWGTDSDFLLRPQVVLRYSRA